MKLGDLYIHKERRNIIQIESYANIDSFMGMYGSCPSFNGYGTVKENRKRI